MILPTRNHELNFHYSTMGGGKTAEILIDEYRERNNGWNTLIAKPETDKKAGRYIQSRIAGGLEAPALVVPPAENAAKLLRGEIARQLGGRAVLENPWKIYIDEAQFLSTDQVEQIATEVVDANIATVEAYGLLNDFRGALFPGSASLLRWADRKIQIESACGRRGCSHAAVINARFLDGVIVTEGPQNAIDGVEASYAALCRQHYRDELA